MSELYDNSPFDDTTKFYSNLRYNRNELGKADSLETPSDYYGNNYQYFKKLICPKTIHSIKRADYLREFDVPGAKPMRLIPIKGRETLNISDIEGTCPKKARVRKTKFDSILNVKDINNREEFKKKDHIKIDNFCLNFSNPHLEKPSWHRNVRPKAESNNYSWAKPSIQKLIWPSCKDYNRKQQCSWDPNNKPESKYSSTNRRNPLAYRRQFKRLMDHYNKEDIKLNRDSNLSNSNELPKRNKTPLKIERNVKFCTPQKSNYLKKNIEKMYIFYIIII